MISGGRGLSAWPLEPALADHGEGVGQEVAARDGLAVLIILMIMCTYMYIYIYIHIHIYIYIYTYIYI